MNLRPTRPHKRAPIQWRAPLWVADAAIIRPATVVFLLSLLAALAMVAISGLVREREDAARELALRARDVAQKHALEITLQSQQIRNFQTRFLALRGTGLVGEEQRLDWIAAIKQSQAQRQLLPISYSIEAQRPLRVDGRFELGDYQLRASRMELHMDLLHEEDLLNLLDDLKLGGGHFAVQRCTITRGSMAANAGQVAGLAGDCTLNWLTLGVPLPSSAPPAAAMAGPGATRGAP